jgi:hypothetical protein
MGAGKRPVMGAGKEPVMGVGRMLARRGNLRRVLATGTGALAVVGLLSPPGLAAGATRATQAWSVQPSPVATARQGQLLGVSCPSATACIAVGSSVSRQGGQTALAERWNGTAWTVLSVPRPAGALTYELRAVSCTSASACTAVGSESTSAADQVPLAERWNGTTWAVQTIPAPHRGDGSFLLGVSCASASVCTAVGGIRDVPDFLTLAERWNGTKWVLQEIPNATPYDSLSAVSCPSASVCTAVGSSSTNNGKTGTVAERWNGTKWAVQSTPNPDRDSSLSAVSCTSGTACTAVGTADRTSAALAERWNGTKWAVQTTTASPADADFLLGVSCTSGTACIAVGYGDGGQGYTPSGTLAEAWNGTTWADQPTPHHGQSVSLNAVSCASATACTAVGTDQTGTGVTLAEAWNGVHWALQPSPNPLGAEASSLAGISCGSTSACAAVGTANDHVDGLGGGTLAEQWNGNSWVIEPAPKIPGAITGYLSRSELSAVSCTSAGACTAVGHYGAGSGLGYLAGLAERWNGTAWAVQPLPTSGEFSPLSGVSCPSATSCTAVGIFFKSKVPYKVLAERWNGTKWTTQTTPNPAGDVSMGGVSCTSATACTLVGSYESGDNQFTLAERWNGTKWTTQTTPNPAGSAESYLTGVSCTSATACVAVGYASGTKTGSIDVPLAERWNGTTWTIQTTPNPVRSSVTELHGVSCSSATACTAVGSTARPKTGDVDMTLAELWNGKTWAIQSPPSPGVSGNELDAVFCQPAIPCTAAGDYDTTVSRPLVERRS